MAGVTAVDQPAVGTANATGDLVISWKPGPRTGYTWAVSVYLPTAGSASAFVYLTSQRKFPLLGSQPSAVIEVSGGQLLSVRGTGFAPGAQYVAFATGQMFQGGPQGIAPQGLPTLVNVSKITITTVHAIIVPVVATVGVYTGRRPLAGTTTPVPIIPPTRTMHYFENLKIGWAVWGDITNAGDYIYIGDAAGGMPTDWARIPSGKGNLIGRFNVQWGNAWVARVTGKAGDVVNVWAAQMLGGPSVDFMGSGSGAAVSTSFLSLHSTRTTTLSGTGAVDATWTPLTTSKFQIGTQIVVNPTTPGQVTLAGAGAYLLEATPTLRMAGATSFTASVKWRQLLTPTVSAGATLHLPTITWILGHWAGGFTFFTHAIDVSLPTVLLCYLEGTAPTATLAFGVQVKTKPATAKTALTLVTYSLTAWHVG